MVSYDKTFLGRFDFGPGELPGGSPQRMFYYPGASTLHGHDGALISVTPDDAEPWVGMFADAGRFQTGTHAVALPDRVSIAVVCGGAAYRVSAQDPYDWVEMSPSSFAGQSYCRPVISCCSWGSPTSWLGMRADTPGIPARWCMTISRS
jgi:hypothetical protein